MTRLCALFIAAAFLLGGALPAQASATDWGPKLHAYNEYGKEPKYAPGFPHWDYVNPKAPKGGEITLSTIGTFDSFNSYIIKGNPAAGTSLLYDTLLTTNNDEALQTVYADLAEYFQFSKDGLSLRVKLREGAYYHDGHPITAEDVVFTHEVLEEKGAPRFRTRFYAEVESVEALDDFTVKFTAKSPESLQVLVDIATFPVLPKHYWQDKEFDSTSLEPPLGSGPYKIADVDPGRSLRYERVDTWWAKDLPQNLGLYNFDKIRYVYYRDSSISFEAFKAGDIDFMTISSSREWATGFKGLSSVEKGHLVLEEIPSTDPEGFSGFWLNLRREPFKDIKVREALLQFYDFETAKRTIHYGLYERVDSYFPNSEMAASGRPDGRELEILEQFRDRIPARIFEEEIKMPKTDGSGRIRSNLRKAKKLFAEAGWEVRDGKLTNTATGEPMAFEILFRSPVMERVINPLVENFKRGGIEVTPRLVDTAQFRRRIDNFDFDVISLGLRAFYPPGRPFRGLWNSEAADELGRENFSGIKDPVLDELVEIMIRAREWDELVASARALDRYILWQHVTIPTFRNDADRIGYWDIFARPETKPRFGFGFPTTWWFDPSNEAALAKNR